MNYTIETIAEFVDGKPHICFPGSMVGGVMIDHRDLHWKRAMFAAIKGTKYDGHSFIPELIQQGVRHFLVTDDRVIKEHEGDANFIKVEDITKALQDIAAEHRDNFKTTVLGITGSNGKTIVKEWLNSLLEQNHSICRSPKSYNSQIGAALSVQRIERNHTLAIFEAGISKPGEMKRLQRMIAPTIGVFTNLGEAHAAHFKSSSEKLTEKLLLFEDTEQIVCCEDQPWFKVYKGSLKDRMVTWSRKNKEAGYFIKDLKIGDQTTVLKVRTPKGEHQFAIPFTDRASIENAMHCFVVMDLLHLCNGANLRRFAQLSPVAMRMEVKQGIENSILVDDSYNADIDSLQAALEQLIAQRGRKRMVILTDISDSHQAARVYQDIATLLMDAKIDHLVTIGAELERHRALFDIPKVSAYPDTDSFWKSLDQKSLRNMAILIKGARKFRLEQLVQRLQAQQHETVLEIDLHKLGQNLRYFRSQLHDKCKIMVMVKAFGYGAGGYEVANYLQSEKVDVLAVAYADEGRALRKQGIRMPIMVMSPGKSSYEAIIKNNLQPEIYSLKSLKDFIAVALNLRHMFDQVEVHLKLNTGMHRLGVDPDDVDEVVEVIKEHPWLRISSVFTHLSAANDEQHDAFTQRQLDVFMRCCGQVQEQLSYPIDRHALNTAGALRWKEHQLDMVRLGIGIYGFSGTEHNKFFQATGAFKTYIIQIHNVPAGDSVGYDRGGIAEHDRRIATVAVGYGDGLDRRLGNGAWSVKWQGTPCPTVGTICMDMCMIDVTNCDAREGDEVVVFSGSEDIERIAALLDTIPYEVLCNVSERVRRVYLQE